MLQSGISEWWTLDITFFFFLILSLLYFVFFFFLCFTEYPLKRLQNSRDCKISTYQFVLSSYRWCFLINCPNPGGNSVILLQQASLLRAYRVSKKKRFVFFFFSFPLSLNLHQERYIYTRMYNIQFSSANESNVIYISMGKKTWSDFLRKFSFKQHVYHRWKLTIF